MDHKYGSQNQTKTFKQRELWSPVHNRVNMLSLSSVFFSIEYSYIVQMPFSILQNVTCENRKAVELNTREHKETLLGIRWTETECGGSNSINNCYSKAQMVYPELCFLCLSQEDTAQCNQCKNVVACNQHIKNHKSSQGTCFPFRVEQTSETGK